MYKSDELNEMTIGQLEELHLAELGVEPVITGVNWREPERL